MSSYIKQAASRSKLHKYASAAKCVRRQRTLEKYAYLMKFAEETTEEASEAKKDKPSKLEESQSKAKAKGREFADKQLKNHTKLDNNVDAQVRLFKALGHAPWAMPTAGAAVGAVGGGGGGYLLAKLLKSKKPGQAALLTGLGGAVAGGLAGHTWGTPLAAGARDAVVARYGEDIKNKYIDNWAATDATRDMWRDQPLEEVLKKDRYMEHIG